MGGTLFSDGNTPRLRSPEHVESDINDETIDKEFINHGNTHFNKIRSQWLNGTLNNNDTNTQSKDGEISPIDNETIETNETNDNDIDMTKNKTNLSNIINDNNIEFTQWYDIEDDNLNKIYKDLFDLKNFEKPIPLGSMIEIVRKLWMQEEQAGYEYTDATQMTSAMNLDRLQ